MIANPAKTQKYAVPSAEVVKYARDNQPFVDEIVSAGDCLYIPRGFIHEGCTIGADSLHITLGFFPTRLVDLLREVVSEDLELLSSQSIFRQSTTFASIDPTRARSLVDCAKRHIRDKLTIDNIELLNKMSFERYMSEKTSRFPTSTRTIVE